MDERRKRLLYRATHRGTQEADRLVGGFARARLDDLDSHNLDRFEALLNESDADLVDWIAGRTPPPALHDGILLRMMIDFMNKL